MTSRISRTEAIQLLADEEFLSLGRQAHNLRLAKNPAPRVTFVIDRNINYTNICSCQCRFCAYYRQEDDPEAFVLDQATLAEKITETLALGGTQILLQGGLHPHLKIPYYEALLQTIRKNFPTIHIHGFSAPEIWHISTLSDLSLEETICRLRDAGLGSIPGGGAEILDDRVRKHISPNKIGWQQWLQVMEVAHRHGLRSTATMMFGSVETAEELVDHLLRVRELQDKTGGFTAFIPWSFQPDNTDLKDEVPITATGIDYLRVLALSRIVLDNIDNIQASWVTQGAKTAQVALYFGANDFGSTMIEENVVAAAGVHFRMSLEEMISTIREAGFMPAQRNTFYDIIKEFHE
ncbi:MAG: dehypoxanthine futalosine cyclase [Deltaproteobacteria bacterium]|nr:dehypoxanthine futalosine cyclase [Candidatus Anaeroferrophillus wilburensis]MBN2888695.1 dehypoxanthine futalosine cyclase [Deltaproteobacteria bacterium]